MSLQLSSLLFSWSEFTLQHLPSIDLVELYVKSCYDFIISFVVIFVDSYEMVCWRNLHLLYISSNLLLPQFNWIRNESILELDSGGELIAGRFSSIDWNHFVDISHHYRTASEQDKERCNYSSCCSEHFLRFLRPQGIKFHHWLRK